jgi:hypothetical protein
MLYVDPGAGSIALQLALAALVTGAYAIKRWWTSITSVLQRGISRFRPSR